MQDIAIHSVSCRRDLTVGSNRIILLWLWQSSCQERIRLCINRRCDAHSRTDGILHRASFTHAAIIPPSPRCNCEERFPCGGPQIFTSSTRLNSNQDSLPPAAKTSFIYLFCLFHTSFQLRLGNTQRRSVVSSTARRHRFVRLSTSCLICSDKTRR